MCITHKGKIHRFKTVNNVYHVGGEVDGLWFDNFTLEGLPKTEFMAKTGHTYIKQYYVWSFWLKLISGLFYR